MALNIPFLSSVSPSRDGKLFPLPPQLNERCLCAKFPFDSSFCAESPQRVDGSNDREHSFHRSEVVKPTVLSSHPIQMRRSQKEVCVICTKKIIPLVIWSVINMSPLNSGALVWERCVSKFLLDDGCLPSNLSFLHFYSLRRQGS